MPYVQGFSYIRHLASGRHQTNPGGAINQTKQLTMNCVCICCRAYPVNTCYGCFDWIWLTRKLPASAEELGQSFQLPRTMAPDAAPTIRIDWRFLTDLGGIGATAPGTEYILPVATVSLLPICPLLAHMDPCLSRLSSLLNSSWTRFWASLIPKTIMECKRV